MLTTGWYGKSRTKQESGLIRGIVMKELMKWNFKTKLETYKSMAVISGRIMLLLLPKKQQRPDGPDQRKWWQKAGIGVQYQIEKRPNVGWDRDYVEFNKSMMDEKGNLIFNGPLL